MSLGNINSCQNPKRIINPYTDEVMYVECRNCESCRNRYSKHWSDRVARECEFHIYSMLLTLTYSNDNLPMFKMCWNDSVDDYQMLSNRVCDADEVLPEDYNGVSHRMNHSVVDGVPYVCRNDVVLFLKRLRSAIYYYFKINHIDGNYKIRYFLCAEYSPRGLRPHYHLIVWFDHEEIARHFGTFVSKSWTYGIFNYSLVQSSAPQYVAKYVACDTRLPKVLRLKQTRTFHLQSKNPCIGYNEVDKKELFKNVIDGTYGHLEPDVTTQSAVYVQPPRSLEMRYFPKCRGWRTLSYFEKLRVYSFAVDFEHLNGYLPSSSELHECFESAVDIHAALACFRFCKEMSSTPEMYLMYVDRYYSNKSLFQLRLQYEYQMTYVNDLHQPVSHLMDFDPVFYERIPKYHYGLTPSMTVVLSTYGIDADALYHHGVLNGFLLDSLKQRNSSFYLNNVNLQKKISIDSNKSRVLNEQLNGDIFSC